MANRRQGSTITQSYALVKAGDPNRTGFPLPVVLPGVTGATSVARFLFAQSRLPVRESFATFCTLRAAVGIWGPLVED